MQLMVTRLWCLLEMVYLSFPAGRTWTIVTLRIKVRNSAEAPTDPQRPCLQCQGVLCINFPPVICLLPCLICIKHITCANSIIESRISGCHQCFFASFLPQQMQDAASIYAASRWVRHCTLRATWLFTCL